MWRRLLQRRFFLIILRTTLEGVEAATGYNVSYTAESGKATITATGSGTLDSAGWVLIGRMKFAPVGGAGVALPADGVLKPVPSGFKATAGSQTINGAAATSVSAPTARLYPFALDIDENGSVNTNDLGYLQSCLGLPVSALTNKKYRVFVWSKRRQYERPCVFPAVFGKDYPTNSIQRIDLNRPLRPPPALIAPRSLRRSQFR